MQEIPSGFFFLKWWAKATPLFGTSKAVTGFAKEAGQVRNPKPRP
uniref:Uncharacterized protein n=1 Tax=Siphoviridae sp. ct3es5 TaxID=2825322 RepID=A0A8S5PTZ2_9CAUD|nr:MAG TPA: hypothetical protein [Siphoviridae sp. ct3es5]